jgi:serine/threonine protein kinase
MSSQDPDAGLPTNLGGLSPEQLFARGMHSVKMSSAGALGWTPPKVEEVARLLPQYEILAMIGHGGMGAVYKGRQEALDRLVAIKLLPLEISVDATFAERFRREARAMARLSHPNIVPVYDFGQTSEGHLFFVMEFVDGAMLHDLIHTKPSLSQGTALGWWSRCAKRWPTRMCRAWCTAISSPRMCSWLATAG